MFKMTEEMANMMIDKISRHREKYRSVTMSGPFHPLEFRVTALHRQASCRLADVTKEWERAFFAFELI